jgi:hypothetical protein
MNIESLNVSMYFRDRRPQPQNKSILHTRSTEVTVHLTFISRSCKCVGRFTVHAATINSVQKELPSEIAEPPRHAVYLASINGFSIDL